MEFLSTWGNDILLLVMIACYITGRYLEEN